MKKTLLFLPAILMLSAPAVAQRVMVDDFVQLKLHYATPEITVAEGEYLTLGAEGYVSGGEAGAPAVPVLNSLLTVPDCDDMELVVENAVYDTIQLPSGRLMPLQPSRSKSDRGKAEMVVDEVRYATDAFYGRPLVDVKMLGTARDRNYAVLSWSPVQVNPVSGMMIVCRCADVTVRYLGSDASATLKRYYRHHTPAFSLGNTLNTLFSSVKETNVLMPVRMVVVVPPTLQCAAVDEFVAWKRTQGMLVDVLTIGTGASASMIALQLRQMYDEATDELPAPTYLVLIGDDNLMPAFDSRLSGGYGMNDHVTDLYYVTWTGNDVLPDCYQGRLSARDTASLQSIIEKTLYYERYAFSNDSYLANAALIAGVDQTYYVDTTDNAYTCADPTMDYIAYYYANSDNGFSQVTYYKNNTNYAPDGVTVTGSSRGNATTMALRTLYNNGVGLINYSAHGDWNCWYMPAFYVSNVNNMSNTGKPSFMIGNCCLSNKFDENTCFGEALLRKEGNAGAVAYIGATNSTYWDEDFYWAVGLRNNIRNRMAPQYDSVRMGSYDRLFHTHNETFDDMAVTAGSMVVAGCMSVNSSTSSGWSSLFAKYYWEIYELMGDPSLMPWLGRASELSVTGLSDNVTLQLTAVPNAYVALVRNDDSLSLVAAAYADETGAVQLPVSGVSLTDCFVSVTAQGYKPYARNCNDINLGMGSAVAGDVNVSPNPATGRCSVTAAGLRRVVVLNLMGQTLFAVESAADCAAVDVSALPAGLYLLRVETLAGASVKKLLVR